MEATKATEDSGGAFVASHTGDPEQRKHRCTDISYIKMQRRVSTHHRQRSETRMLSRPMVRAHDNEAWRNRRMYMDQTRMTAGSQTPH